DIAALWRRALELGAPQSPASGRHPRATPDVDTACLADALADPGRASQYSAVGYRRIVALADELTALRAHLCHPLPDLVAEVRRVLAVDCEAWATLRVAHLDAFADVVAGYVERTSTTANPAPPTVSGLLAYLDVATVVENGLPPAAPAVAADRIQVLTVHAAKGLEWQVVAVPHLVTRVFPSTAVRGSWLTDAGELPPLLRGDRVSLGAHGVPVLDTSDVTDRKQLSDKISEHRRQLDQRRVDEERRLLYVAITRAEDTLLVSGYHWGATETRPRGPSEFLCQLRDVIESSATAGQDCGVIEHWASAPADGERNPLRDTVVEAVWPADPLGPRRGDVDTGAALVSAAMAGGVSAPPAVPADTDGWAADVDALLAERARVAAGPPAPALPSQVSVSNLVDLARDPAGAARRSQSRRLPTRPDPHALLGSAFHDWVQRHYGAERLFDL
ncbi:MAG: 3'-5' exonuclease, partial [Mycobacterium sp.]